MLWILDYLKEALIKSHEILQGYRASCLRRASHTAMDGR